MKVNKQSAVYTILYIIVVVVVVGAALACVAMSLRAKQQANADADKMGQILASAHIAVENGDVFATFNKYIVSQPVYDAQGKVLDGQEAFKVDVAAEAAKPAAEREYPLYICRLADGQEKVIIPLSGAGLWGPIWGYLALDNNATCTIYGAYFDHKGETPGLGAEIAKPFFSDQFAGKTILAADGKFTGVAVVKKGQKPTADVPYVDGISGGTITSKGVDAMLANCLAPYEPILKSLVNK